MKINLSKLSDADLAQLIAAAGAELSRRLTEEDRIVRRPTAPETVVVDEPPIDEKDFVLYVKGLMRSGSYIKSEERRRVTEIAAQYPTWVRMQGVPTTSGAGEWKKATAFSSARRAQER